MSDVLLLFERQVLMAQLVTRVSSNRIFTWLRSLLLSDTPKTLFITNPRVRIFLLSFAMLFFELLCIRWIPSYVRFLSYFNNFVLLASFLGIGLGMLTARRKRFWFPPFPLMVLLLAIIVMWNKFDLHISSTQVLYYGAGETQGATADNYAVLPIIFGLVTACFIPLSRSFGQLFKNPASSLATGRLHCRCQQRWRSPGHGALAIQGTLLPSCVRTLQW